MQVKDIETSSNKAVVTLHKVDSYIEVAQQLISGDGKVSDSIKDEKLIQLFTTSVEAKDKEEKVI